jgi:peptidoglycan biosynthesis protein MviN/MurJ (putative lipid II flippase)
MRVTARRVTWKVLLVSAAVSVVLFVIAAPFGHDHHGIGLVMSDIFWPLFLISVGVFIILALIAVVQLVVARRPRRRPT